MVSKSAIVLIAICALLGSSLSFSIESLPFKKESSSILTRLERFSKSSLLKDRLGKVCTDSLFGDIVEGMGYPYEAHTTQTEDGYVLKLFRLQGKGSKIVAGKTPVILQHGIIDSADDWVVNLNNSLGFFLADQGYDVWLSNSRGNKYSKQNVHYGPHKREFWYYSFQQMGEYDVPANIGYILKETGKEKLVYAGHSQGTSQMFAALSDPKTTEYVNSKVSLFLALAPVVYLPHSTAKILKILAENEWLFEQANFWGIEEWAPGACRTDSTQSRFEELVCKRLPEICDWVTSVADAHPKYDNLTRLPFFAEHNPSGTSLRTLQHYRQNLLQLDKKDPKFKMYDYGSKRKNKEHYGQDKPPEYDLSKIKIPVRGFVGFEDKLGDPKDNAILKKNLEALNVDYQAYSYDKCGHMTFMWGLDTSPMWNDVLAEIKKVE